MGIQPGAEGRREAWCLTLSSHWQEEMSGESVVSSAVPAAATRTTSFKGASPSSKYVKLNVGGALYYTTMQTLTKQDTMLKAMFSGRMEVLTDSEGEFTCQPPAAGCWFDIELSATATLVLEDVCLFGVQCSGVVVHIDVCRKP